MSLPTYPSIYPSLHDTPDTQSISPQMDRLTDIRDPTDEMPIEKPTDVKKT